MTSGQPRGRAQASVTGDDPDALLDEVAALREIAGCASSRPWITTSATSTGICPTAACGMHPLSLRLRQIDDRKVFTAKGGTSNSEGLFRRYRAGGTRHARELDHSAGADRRGRHAGRRRHRDDPQEPGCTGLVTPTQDRRPAERYGTPTRSRARPPAGGACRSTGPGSTSARRWSITGRSRSSKLGGGDVAPREIGRALLARYPDRLEPSTMGKYSRGLAIERELRATGALDQL